MTNTIYSARSFKAIQNGINKAKGAPAIATELNDRKIRHPSGKPWDHHRVRTAWRDTGREWPARPLVAGTSEAIRALLDDALLKSAFAGYGGLDTVRLTLTKGGGRRIDLLRGRTPVVRIIVEAV